MYDLELNLLFFGLGMLFDIVLYASSQEGEDRKR